MSLDVYLNEEIKEPCEKCGHHNTRLLSRVYSDSITHNLSSMASAAGLYHALWRPNLAMRPVEVAQYEALRDVDRYDDARQIAESLPMPRAIVLVGPLRDGLQRLRSDPERYRSLNPKNGWGSYDTLVTFVTNYLAACEEHPDAIVEVSR